MTDIFNKAARASHAESTKKFYSRKVNYFSKWLANEKQIPHSEDPRYWKDGNLIAPFAWEDVMEFLGSMREKNKGNGTKKKYAAASTVTSFISSF